MSSRLSCCMQSQLEAIMEGFSHSYGGFFLQGSFWKKRECHFFFFFFFLANLLSLQVCDRTYNVRDAHPWQNKRFISYRGVPRLTIRHRCVPFLSTVLHTSTDLRPPPFFPFYRGAFLLRAFLLLVYGFFCWFCTFL